MYKCNLCKLEINDDYFKPCYCDNHYHEECYRLEFSKNDVIINKNCNICSKNYRIDFKNENYRKLYILYQSLNNLFFFILIFVYITSLFLLFFNYKLSYKILCYYSLFLWFMILSISIKLYIDDYKIWGYWFLNLLIIIIFEYYSNYTIIYITSIPLHIILKISKNYLYYLSTEFWYLEVKSIHNYCL